MRFPLALCLGLVALAAASPSPLQRRVVREVLDYVNGRSSTQLLFKEQAVEGAVERVSAGAAEPRDPGRGTWRPSPRPSVGGDGQDGLGGRKPSSCQ